LKGYEEGLIRFGEDGKSNSSGEGFLVLDTLFKSTPFGEIPWNLEGTKVLVTLPEKAKFIKIEASKGIKNTFFETVECKLHEDGSIDCFLEKNSAGQGAIYDKNILMNLTYEERKKVFENEMTINLPNSMLINYKAVNLENNEPLVEKIEYKYLNYAAKTDDLLIFDLSATGLALGTSFISDKRTYPVKFPYNNLVTQKVIIDIPEGYKIKEMPANLSLKSSIGMFTAKVYTVGNKIEIVKNYLRDRSFFEAKEYKDLKNFYDSMVNFNKGKIILQKFK